MYPLVNHEATGAQIAWTVPPMLSTAIMVAMGNKIAEMARPIMAIPQEVPEHKSNQRRKHEIASAEKYSKHGKTNNKGTCICFF